MKNLSQKAMVLLLSIILAVSCCMGLAAAVDIDQSTITKDDLFISENVAYNIAMLFVNDAISLNSVEWDEETQITATVCMYDPIEANKITAYTFELDQGYVVIAAYLDAPSVILEWSDTAAPIYDEFSMTEGDHVVYAGACNYYKDTGSILTLQTIDGYSVARSEINNTLKAKSSFSNVPENILASIASSKLVDNSVLRSETPRDPYIDDPFTHAQAIYGGTYTNHEWRNDWENYVEYHTTSEFKNLNGGYVNHCGPTAITNMLIMYGNRYNITSITSKTADDLFIRAAERGRGAYYYNTDALGVFGGTVNVLAGEYIEAVFSFLGETVSSAGRYTINYNNIKTSLSNNRLVYVMTSNHGIYGDHHMVCFAYTQLKDSTLSRYHTYLKLADGHGTHGRYVDIATVSGDQYWEVSF